MNREQRRHAANGVGLHLPSMMAQAQVPQQAGPVFNVGPLMNDVQLIAFVASQRHGTPAEAVDFAVAVVAETVRRAQNGDLARQIQGAEPQPPAAG